jgi:transcriptional regulator of aromatic amino acid metabolism
MHTVAVTAPHPAPDEHYPVLGRDLSALIAVVATLEAESALDELPAHLEQALLRRLVEDAPSARSTSASLRTALAGLAERLHAGYGG